MLVKKLVKKFTEYEEPEISLSLTQQLATCPYLEPEESNSRVYIFIYSYVYIYLYVYIYILVYSRGKTGRDQE